MNAGLPGTGIGGLFYIAGAIMMPFHRARRGGGHAGRSWRRVMVQLFIAAGILAGLYATGVALGLLLTPEAVTGGVGAAATATSLPTIIRWAAVIGTVGILMTVLLVVEGLGLFFSRRRRRRLLRVVWTPANGELQGIQEDLELSEVA